MDDVEQTQKMIPFITCEISLCQYVCELVLGVNGLKLHDSSLETPSFRQPLIAIPLLSVFVFLLLSSPFRPTGAPLMVLSFSGIDVSIVFWSSYFLTIFFMRVQLCLFILFALYLDCTQRRVVFNCSESRSRVLDIRSRLSSSSVSFIDRTTSSHFINALNIFSSKGNDQEVLENPK